MLSVDSSRLRRAKGQRSEGLRGIEGQLNSGGGDTHPRRDEKSAEVIDKQRVVRRPSRKRVRQPLKRKDLNEKKAEMKVARGEKAGTCEWPTQGRTAHKYTTYRLLSC